jgi:hypothetical protein
MWYSCGWLVPAGQTTQPSLEMSECPKLLLAGLPSTLLSLKNAGLYNHRQVSHIVPSSPFLTQSTETFLGVANQ